MALKDPNFVLTFDYLSEGSYRVPSDKSLLVEEVYVNDIGSTEEFIQFLIDRTTVGYFMIGGSRHCHLEYRRREDPEDSNILVSMRKKGIFKGYPVASGQTFSWKTQNGNPVFVTIKGKLYDAGDIKTTDENGTESKVFTYVNYGRPSSNPTKAGDILVDESISPAEFPNFPFGGVVPAKSRITIYGICANPAGRTSGGGANKCRTWYLKFMKGREVLFNPARAGIFNYGIIPASDGVDYINGRGLLNFNSSLDKKPAFWFEEPLVFEPGEELNIFHTVSVDSGSMNFTADDLLIALIMKEEKLE